MEDLPKRRPGRPAKDPAGAKRANLKMRIHDRTRAALEKIAAENGRSLSEEAEVRLEYSLHLQNQLDQTLDLAFGRTVSGLLLMLGPLLRDVGAHAGFISTSTLEGAANWLNDPYAFDQAAEAVSGLLEELRPEGEINIRKFGKTPWGYDVDAQHASLGVSFSRTALGAVAGEELTTELAKMGAAVRDRLGAAVVERIRQRKAQGERQDG